MSKRLKIGIVTGEYPPDEGGVGDYTRLLAIALADLGHDVHIVTHRRARIDGGLTVHPIVGRWGWSALWRIRQLVGSIQFDIVNIQYQAAAYGMTAPIHFLPGFVGRPTVVTFHDLRVPYLFPKAGSLRREAVRWLARSARGVIVTNSDDFNTLSSERQTAHLIEIPIGSNIMPDTRHLGARRFAESVQFGLKADHPVIGYFGFLNASKGGDVLLKAIAELPGFQLLLIGGQTGSSDATNQAYAIEIDALATSLGIRDRLRRTGFLTSSDATRALLACDLMAMPYADGASLRRGSLMACLAHGIPTISTQPAAAVPELQQGYNIWLVPRGDYHGLAQAARNLMGDDTLRKRLASGALQLAQEFTWDRIAARTADFYRKVLTAGS